jgi:hypothetical protein
MGKPGFTDHDAGLIDDLRKAFSEALGAGAPYGLPSDKQGTGAIIAFERAVSKVVLKRSKGKG